MILKHIMKLIKPERKLQRDTFKIYEYNIWQYEIRKIRENKHYILVDYGVDDKNECMYIEYFIR